LLLLLLLLLLVKPWLWCIHHLLGHPVLNQQHQVHSHEPHLWLLFLLLLLPQAEEVRDRHWPATLLLLPAPPGGGLDYGSFPVSVLPPL